MAFASIPPCGGIYDAQKRRYLRQRENTTPDPVERCKLREARLIEEFRGIGRAMVSQAKKNAKAAEQQELEAQRFEREYYKNK